MACVRDIIFTNYTHGIAIKPLKLIMLLPKRKVFHLGREIQVPHI